MKSTPVIGGDTIYVNGYGAPVNDPGNKVSVPMADEVWPTADIDKNGVLSKAEFPKYTPAFWFVVADLDTDGNVTKDEWAYYRAALDSENGMLAIRLGGSGDMTDKAIRQFAGSISAVCRNCRRRCSIRASCTWSTTTAS
jgi:hypothetical protein